MLVPTGTLKAGFQVEPKEFFQRTHENWFHMEPKRVLPTGQRKEPCLVPYRTFCFKSVYDLYFRPILPFLLESMNAVGPILNNSR
jgi:hypothetical protein